MKILTVVGARPQFIKAAVVSRAVDLHNKNNPELFINEVLVHTGQHYDDNMSEVFFRQMHIPAPHYHLGVSGGLHGEMTGRMLEKIEKVILEEKPDAVMVYGDTNSTLAGALAAVKLQVPVAHVEAGLRSYNMRMPEEINRILTDQISQWLFCPTDNSIKNLKSEGIPGKIAFYPYSGQTVVNVGDVMYDALIYYRQIASPEENIKSLIKGFQHSYYVATIHRAENVDNPQNLRSIFKALEIITQKTPVVLPLHPRTRKMLGGDIMKTPITIIEPVGYLDMISLLSGCKAVFTDSGGVQKEAYFLKKPCVTLREETEWVELVEKGYNTLVGADYEKILDAERNLDMRRADYDNDNLYGTGDAGSIIVRELVCAFG